MNILTSKLPQSVKIGGAEVQINTDFRFSIQFEELLNKYDLDDEEEQIEFYTKALKLYYPILNIDFDNSNIETKKFFNYVIDNRDEAVNKMIWFYRCGKEPVQQIEENISKEPSYSFEYDADNIYSAILDQYGVDLQEIDTLHWWKFKAMFNSLKEDNEISKIISIRATDISKLPKEQQNIYMKLKKYHAIPRKQEEVKHYSNMAAILRNGGDLSQLKE